jgi:hypothetical protein
MNNQEFTEIFKAAIDGCREILSTKGTEYAGNENRLANFEEVASGTGTTPLQVCMVYLMKHIRALQKEAATGIASVESSSRVQDCINYLIFYEAIRLKQKRVGLQRPELVDDSDIRVNRSNQLSDEEDRPYSFDNPGFGDTRRTRDKQ